MHPPSMMGAARAALLLAVLTMSSAAFAGPPLLCHPFDTDGARSLPWGAHWNDPDRTYDVRALPRDALLLLAPETPVIARMETLRRAAIYASRDGAILREIVVRLDQRVAAGAGEKERALAWFDAGYLRETLQEVMRLQGYDMPGVGPVHAEALREVLAGEDGSVALGRAIAGLPNDPAVRFAAALAAAADQRRSDQAAHAALARAGAGRDPLLARNLWQLGD